MIILNIIFTGLVGLLLLDFYYVFVVRRHEQEEEIKSGSKCKNKYDIVAFGSSYARYAYDFKESGLCGYNFGIVAQFFYYTDKMIRSFRETYKPNCYVIITVPDLCFAEVGMGKYLPQRYVRFIRKDILGKEYSFLQYLLQSYFPLFIPSLHNFKQIVKKILTYKFENEYTVLQSNQLSYEQTIALAKCRCQDWIKEFGLKDTQSPNLPKKLYNEFKKSSALLESIIDYCINEGLRPVLVLTPVSECMNRCLSDEFLQEVLYNNIAIANKHNIPVLDYMKDNRFQTFDLYSNNADFLNARGRKLFSKVLVDDIKEAYKNDK